MTQRTPKLPVPEELQRRISDAMAKEHGITGDPDLQKVLASDKGAASYAKDLSRIDMWLASWPVPEPSDEAMEALATRIEQRLGENLPGAMSTFLGEPDFADDDSLRDAAAGILTAGAPKKASNKATLVGVPPLAGLPSAGLKAPLASTKAPLVVAKPMVPKPGAAPIKPAATKLEPAKVEPAKPDTKIEPAKVEAAKPDTKIEPAKPNTKIEPAKPDTKIEPAEVEPAKADAKIEPEAPAAKLEVAVAPPAPKDASVEVDVDLQPSNSGEMERISLLPEVISLVPEVPSARPAPPKTPKAKKARKSDAPPANKASKPDDRISIPMPAPLAPISIGDIAARRSVPPANDRKRAFWPMLAAAAFVGLAVAVGSQFLTTDGASPSATATMVGAAEEDAEFRAAPEAVTPATSSPAPGATPAVAAVVPLPAAPPPATVTASPEPYDALLAAPAEAGAALAEAPMTGGLRMARDTTGADGAADDGPRRRARATSDPDTATRAPRPSGAALGGASGTGSTSGSTSGSPAARIGAGGSAGGSGRSEGAAARGGTAAPSGPLPEVPSREAARDVLDGVAPQVYACFGEEHGLAEVAVIVASSGRVTTSTVSGRFAGTPVGSCIARAIRSARFPAFTNPRFEVHYEYRH